MPDDNQEMQPQEPVMSPAADAPATDPSAASSLSAEVSTAAEADGQSESGDVIASETKQSQSTDAISAPSHSELGEESNAPVTPAPSDVTGQGSNVSQSDALRALTAHAQAKIQSNKQKKLEKLRTFSRTKDKIANEDVQKLLKVSDKTAERYLTELVKEGRLVRTGPKTGSRYHPAL